MLNASASKARGASASKARAAAIGAVDDGHRHQIPGVLHLLDCLNPGGTESQLLGQLRHVDRKRWRPMVGAFHAGGMLLPEVEAMNIPVAAFPLHSSLAHPNTALQIGRIALHCRREGVAIIHAHDFYSNLVGLAAARLCGARVIVSRRDLAHWLSPTQKRVLGFACRIADRVVANARSVAQVNDDGLDLPLDRLDIVPNGLDLTAFDAAAQKAPDPAIDLLDDPEARALTIAVVSNMNLPDKGQADLISACGILAQEGLLLRVIFVGDGPEKPKLQAQAERLGIASRMRFLGRRRDVPRILSRVAAVCLPSWAEGFPNAVMEGMAAGKPVVATQVGGCPELVDDGVSGHLVPPRDPVALAKALSKVFADKAAAEAMGRRAREVIATRFSLKAAAASFDEIYRRLYQG